MTVIVNTSPLLTLERVNCLPVLPALFHRVTRPQSVLDEMTAGQSDYGIANDLLNAEWIKTLPDPHEAYYRRELGAGETAAIALAVNEKADLIILDDLAARNVARELRLQFTGTLGVLMAAYRKELIKDLNQVVDDLQRCGFHMSDSLISYVKRQAGDG